MVLYSFETDLFIFFHLALNSTLNGWYDSYASIQSSLPLSESYILRRENNHIKKTIRNDSVGRVPMIVWEHIGYILDCLNVWNKKKEEYKQQAAFFR